MNPPSIQSFIYSALWLFSCFALLMLAKKLFKTGELMEKLLKDHKPALPYEFKHNPKADLPGCQLKALADFYRDSEKKAKPEPAAPKVVWHIKGRQVASKANPSDQPKTIYYFIRLESPDSPRPYGIVKGESALWSPGLHNFVTTDDPATALMILQLLNEGNLTLKGNLPDAI